ncbi:ankyrin repeat domain protein [Nitzschia inconspicua]|uniref:Ankyrin repeat domain protein n=1 Tax=Nitzschia inconspicua TaxID=303405 RepID=A0A9K3KUW8_9STRA|nr:ankyrin repeat domain protein [Nitzschia inconspicua]
MESMLPCFPSFREFFMPLEDISSTGRDRLVMRIRDNDNLNNNNNINISSSSSEGNHLPTATITTSCHDTSRKRIRSAATVVLKLDVFSGALQVPCYQQVPRDSCPLLRHCWSNNNWQKVVDICVLEPHRALHKTEHSGRTALHLAIFHRQCPLHVAQALLTANRHMVVVQDANRYTPLHMLAFFQPTIPTNLHNITLSQQQQQQQQQQHDEQTRLVKLFCDTAVMVEQELQNGDLIPPAYGTSPLFLAAKRNAPLSTIKTLLQTRKRTQWIAPSTGGEPYWDSQTLDEYSSPLEVLLRDSNRASKYFNLNFLRQNANLREKMRRMAYKRLSKRMRGGVNEDDPTIDSVVDRAAGLEVDPETNANMGHNEMGRKNQHETVVNVVAVNHNRELSQQLDEYKELEENAMILWEKCIELLMGHCPLLQVGDDAAHIPYGVLHAVVSCKVPIPALAQVAMILFPEQAKQRDEQGFIPLHHVLRCNHKYATGSLLNILLPRDDGGPMSPLLEATAMMRFPNDGPTPLAFALLNRLPVDPVIDMLLFADSDVSLRTIDLSTNLYPFCLASLNDDVPAISKEMDKDAESEGKAEDDHLFIAPNIDEETILNKFNVSYRLLRAHPQVLSQLFCVQERPKSIAGMKFRSDTRATGVEQDRIAETCI